MIDDERKISLIITVVVCTVVLFIAVKTCKVFIPVYNDLVNLQESANQAESDVKAVVQRRIELIQDLVPVVQEEARHSEKALKEINSIAEELKDILELANTTDEINAVEKEVSKQMEELCAIARANFTAQESYSRLTAQMEGSVTRVLLARKNYNSKATQYNIAIREMPNCIVARMFGFEPMDLFEPDKEASETKIIEWDD